MHKSNVDQVGMMVAPPPGHATAITTGTLCNEAASELAYAGVSEGPGGVGESGAWLRQAMPSCGGASFQLQPVGGAPRVWSEHAP